METVTESSSYSLEKYKYFRKHKKFITVLEKMWYAVSIIPKHNSKFCAFWKICFYFDDCPDGAIFLNVSFNKYRTNAENRNNSIHTPSGGEAKCFGLLPHFYPLFIGFDDDK